MIFTGMRISLFKSNKANSALLFRILGIALFLVLWQIAAVSLHSLVIASPLDTFYAAGGLLKRDFILRNFSLTITRMLLSVSSGFAIGFASGLISGISRNIRNMLEPFRWMLMSIPAIVFLVVVMLVFGMGSKMIIIFSSFMLCPVVYVNTVKGMDMIDSDLLEMARVYSFSRFRRIRDIYLPGIAGSVFSSLVIITGNGIRIVILSELMGAADGLGAFIASARTNLEIPELYACVLMCLLAAGFFEFAVLRPLQNHFLRWKK